MEARIVENGYQGWPCVEITGEDGKTFSFGAKKARAILASIETIETFVQMVDDGDFDAVYKQAMRSQREKHESPERVIGRPVRKSS